MRAPQALVDRNARRVAKRENLEQADRLHFLVYGHEEHAERCICSPSCSRDYDPLPYPEARPEPAKNYAGTGIGFLYGLPDAEEHAWQLAGWNVARSER